MFVAPLKGQQPLFSLGQRRKIVGGEDLALPDGKIGLDLIQLTGVEGGVQENRVGPTRSKALSSFPPAVSRATIHDPEDTSGKLVGLLAHHLSHMAMNRSNPAFGLTTTEQLGAGDIPGCQIGPRTLAEVFVLDPSGAARGRGQVLGRGTP